MYFSERNEKTVYINHYSGLLEVKGEGILCKEDADTWLDERENWQNQYSTLSVKEGITGLGEGYLEAFPKLGCLILSRTVVSVAVTPELLTRMRRRKVLVRGGKIKSRKTMHGNRFVKAILCQAAWAAVRTRHSPFHDWFWSHRPKLGQKKAIIAVARKLLKLIYHLLNTRQMYRPPMVAAI